MTDSLKWPAWHPKLELRAGHLIKLEEYLLSRVRLCDEGAFGVDSFNVWSAANRVNEEDDRPTSIRVLNTSEGFSVGVRHLQGVTPAGDYVWLFEENRWIEESLGRPYGKTFEFDVWIEVNSREPGADKFTIKTHVVSSEEDQKEVMWAHYPNRLYLGRYRVGQGEGWLQFEVSGRPIPRRFCGFGSPKDPGWQKWVDPLCERIEGLAVEIESQGTSDPFRVVADEVARLRFEWPTLPIPILGRRLRLIRWLRDRADNPKAKIDYEEATQTFDLQNCTGEALPEALADLIPLKGCKPGKKTSWLSVFDSLAGSLGGGIEYHVPLDQLESWRAFIVSSFADAHEHGESLGPARVELLKREKDENVWTKAAAAITRRQLEEAAERSGLKLSAGNESSVSPVVSALETLFDGHAQTSRAGPLAFYWLAKAASSLPELRGSASSKLGAYFRALDDKATPDDAKGTDRVSQFLNRLLTGAPTTATVEPSSGVSGMHQSQGLATSGEILITVLGGSTRGANSLIRQFANCCTNIGYPRLPFAITFNQSVTGPRDSEVGTVRHGGREFVIRISTFAGQGRANPSGSIVAELLLLAVPPDDVAIGAPGYRGILRKELGARPSALAAIAYTNAHEYGVVDSDAVRSDAIRLMSREVLAQADRDNWPESAWTALTGESIDAARRTTGSATFAGRTRAGRREWTDTRVWIVGQTKHLWEDVLPLGRSRLLNGYFVAGDPGTGDLRGARHLESWAGVLHILADFLGCVLGAPGNSNSHTTPLGSQHGRRSDRR